MRQLALQVKHLPDHLFHQVTGEARQMVVRCSLQRSLGVLEKHLDPILRDMISSGLTGRSREYDAASIPVDESYEYSLAELMAHSLYAIFIDGVESYCMASNRRVMAGKRRRGRYDEMQSCSGDSESDCC